MSPSIGVNPMVVATGFPPRVAVAEQPFPRWQTTARKDAGGRPRNSAARPEQ